MEDEMTTSSLLSGTEACFGWLTGVVLLVVALVMVRKVYPTAAYVLAGGAVLRWFLFCCGILPTVLSHSDGIGASDGVYMSQSILFPLLWLLSMGVILASFAVLGRHIVAARGEASGGAR